MAVCVGHSTSRPGRIAGSARAVYPALAKPYLQALLFDSAPLTRFNSTYCRGLDFIACIGGKAGLIPMVRPRPLHWQHDLYFFCGFLWAFALGLRTYRHPNRISLDPPSNVGSRSGEHFVCWRTNYRTKLQLAEFKGILHFKLTKRQTSENLSWTKLQREKPPLG